MDAERESARELAGQACDTRFPARYREAVADHPGVVAWADAAIADSTSCGDLLIIGPVGTGKTWQAYGALRRVATHPARIRRGGYRTPSWRAGVHADIAASMRPSKGVDAEQIMAEYQRAALLLVDDLGLAKDSEWLGEITYRLVNTRYVEQRPTVYTSNLPGSEIREVIGDRIASRLAQTCTVVTLTGEDRRRKP